MTGHADFVLVGHGDDAIEKVGDALPESVGADRAGFGERGFGMRFGELPLVVERVTAAGHAADAQHAEDAHVVLDGRNAGLRAVADEGLQLLDVAVALGALREHDGGMLFAIDVAGFEEGRRGAIDADAVFRGQIDHALELVHGGVEAVALDLRVAADVAHAVTRQVFKVRVVGGSGLVAELHALG